jgi:hypothetical protein
VPAFINLVVIDEFVISALCPTPRGFIVFARKDGHRSRDGDVDGVVKADLIFPIKASRRNRGVRQPVERDVVENVVSCKVACGVLVDRTPEYGRGDRRCRLGITIAVIKKPGCQPDG